MWNLFASSNALYQLWTPYSAESIVPKISWAIIELQSVPEDILVVYIQICQTDLAFCW
jgi:hypothetical protein